MGKAVGEDIDFGVGAVGKAVGVPEYKAEISALLSIRL